MRAHRPPHRSAVAPPRRRHPARVYWVRRLLALSVVAAVVVGMVGLGRLVTGEGEAGPGDDRATAAAADPDESPSEGGEGPRPGSPADTEADEQAGQKAGQKAGQEAGGRTKSKEPLAEPDGPCEPEDVLVSPSVRQAEAPGGSPVTIRLDLTTISSEACEWVVSPESLTLRVTRGGAEVWSTRQCPDALESEDVVVRQERRKRVRVEWSTKLFDDDCAIQTGWARLGTYGLEAAALAGEPRDAEFELVKPER